MKQSKTAASMDGCCAQEVMVPSKVDVPDRGQGRVRVVCPLNVEHSSQSMNTVSCRPRCLDVDGKSEQEEHSYTPSSLLPYRGSVQPKQHGTELPLDSLTGCGARRKARARGSTLFPNPTCTHGVV